MIHSIDRHSPDFPELLREIHDPPDRLYAQGNLSLLNSPCLAMVGMRRCSQRGAVLSHRWARELSRKGVTIVSGLAFGIDAAAHRGALEGGGRTIAVLPGALNDIVPHSHRALAQEIVQKGGLLLSEHESPPTLQKHDFLIRNRLISGISQAVLVVEAAQKSGALNTANHAADQNREVLAVPGRIEDKESEGCLNLIRNGAALILSPEDIVELLGLATLSVPDISLPEALQEIYDLIRASPFTPPQLRVDQIPLLTQLELEGWVKRDAAGVYTPV